MVDDTLGVSICGYKTRKISEFLNTRTKLMNLQYGCNKCEKIHIGKRQNEDICPTITIDSWEEEVIENRNKEKELKDTYTGQEALGEVSENKYLGKPSKKKNIYI